METGEQVFSVVSSNLDLLKASEMPPSKNPTSSVSGSSTTIYFSSLRLTAITATVFRLLVDLIWYRFVTLVWRVYSGVPFLGAPTTRSSPAAGLPLDLIETVVAYLTYDTCSLRACTLTCYLWYIAAAPHLHRALICPAHSLPQDRYTWPLPLIEREKLGLLPLVKTFWVRGDITHRVAFSPLPPSWHILLPLFRLTNINQLRIDYLDIPSFIPCIQLYPGHFLPTLRGLALTDPNGSCREIIYFIGLFQHLQDLKLYVWRIHREEPVGGPTLIPPFIPPLRGLLTIKGSAEVNLFKDMINLFGGLRFRHMDLFEVDTMRLLLDACAKTLESVVLDPTDSFGEQFSPENTQILANNFAATRSLQDLDLSRLESLRTLKLPASSIRDGFVGGPDTITFFKHILPAITSSTFSEVVVIFWDSEFRGAGTWRSDQPPFRELSQIERAEEISRHCWKFGILRQVHAVRAFQLVLCASTWGRVGEYPVQILEEAVAEEKARGGFCGCFSPLVVYDPRRISDDR